MSIFGRMFKERDVKEITPGQRPSPPLVRFFEVLYRKMFLIAQLNAIHVCLSILALVILYFFTPIFIQQSVFGTFFSVAGGDELLGLAADYVSKFFLLCYFFCMSLICVGPFQAGFYTVLKNMVSEKHTWVFTDYIRGAKENLKQSAIVSIINFVVFYVIAIAINYYLYDIRSGNILNFLCVIFLVFCLLLFMMINMHIYLLMISFKLPIKELYKNALTFSYMRFYQNIFAIIITAALYLVVLYFFKPAVFLLLYLFIIPGLFGFISSFVAYEGIKKHMLDSIPSQNSKKT